MFTSYKGIVTFPKAIDFPKQRVRHGIYSNFFFFEGFSIVSTQLLFKKA
jgi:hypothetical protein